MSSRRSEVLLSILAYSICSGTLVLLNKITLYHIPFPSLVVCIQLSSTIAFIYAMKYTNKLQVDDLVWRFIKPYLYYTVAFSLGVYCNMKSLSISNVETVIVFRAISPCLVAVLDVAFLGREFPSRKSWMALFIIVLGAIGYASNDDKFRTQGVRAYIWPILYLFIISFEMAYGKRIIRSVDLKTQSGPVLYTNVLGIWPFLIFAEMSGEYHRFYESIIVQQHSISTTGYVFLLLGCVTGTAIGYCSWWCRDKVAATTFTLVGVMNKCLTVLLNLIIWDQHATPMGIACLFVCLLGGMIYEQAPLRPDVKAAALLTANDADPVWNEKDDDDHEYNSSNISRHNTTTNSINSNGSSNFPDGGEDSKNDSINVIEMPLSEQQPLMEKSEKVTLRVSKATV